MLHIHFYEYVDKVRAGNWSDRQGVIESCIEWMITTVYDYNLRKTIKIKIFTYAISEDGKRVAREFNKKMNITQV